MPPLIFLAVVGAIGYAGYKKLSKEAERIVARSRREEKEARSGSQGTLVQDPKTGVYTIAKD